METFDDQNIMQIYSYFAATVTGINRQIFLLNRFVHVKLIVLITQKHSIYSFCHKVFLLMRSIFAHGNI